MAIQNVTITFKAKKTTGADVVWTLPGGGTGNTITATAATESSARAAVQTVIDNSIASAQGNVQDQQDASGAFNS